MLDQWAGQALYVLGTCVVYCLRRCLPMYKSVLDLICASLSTEAVCNVHQTVQAIWVLRSKAD